MRRWVRISAGAFVTAVVAAGVIAYTSILSSAPGNTVVPVISGTDQVDVGTLTVDDGTWTNSPSSFSYQWQRCNTPTCSATITNIGTNANTYALVGADDGTYHRVIVTATNGSGSSAATSAMTGPTSSSSGGATLANVWMAPNGSDFGANCVPSAVAITNPDSGGTSLCASLNKAYHVGGCGETVGMLNGDYDGGTSATNFTTDATKVACGSNLVFRAASGALVNIGSVALGLNLYTGTSTNGINHVTLQGPGITVDSKIHITNSSDVLIDQVTMKFFFLSDSQNVTLSNSDIGNCTATGPGGPGCNIKIDPKVNTSSRYSTDNILISGNYIHDIKSTNLAGSHIECMFLRAEATIRGNKFNHCHLYDIFLQSGGACCGQAFQDVTIENNWMGPGDVGFASSYCIRGGFGGSPSSKVNAPANLTVRFNTCDPSKSFGIEASGGCGSVLYTNAQLTGNLGAISCYAVQPNLAWKHNCWTQAITAIGTDFTSCTAGLVDAPNFNFHIDNSSDANNLVPTSDTCPALDIDLVARPIGANCDAGSDER